MENKEVDLPFIIAIDFDGTICNSNFPEFGDPIDGAIYYINKLAEFKNLYIIIWTCRHETVDAVSDWLLLHRIPFHNINKPCPQSIEKYGNDSRKIGAEVYVDDKQVGGLPHWRDIYKHIEGKYNEWRER